MTAARIATRRRAALAILSARLIDDAAIFPPGNAPMAAAVSAHLRRLDGPDAPAIGPFVCPLARLGELALQLEAEASARPAGSTGARLEVAVVVPAGTDHLCDRLSGLFGAGGPMALRAIEAKLDGDGLGDSSRLEELASFAGASDSGGAVEVYVEPPTLPDGAGELAALAALGLRAKLRTGGLSAAAFPGAVPLARAITAAAAAGVGFKCTAGLHRAVRHLDEDGFSHHGFCNVLVAAKRAVVGADPDAVVEALEVEDGHRLAEELGALEPDEALALRAAFCSFGTCSVDEPLQDLAGLGLAP